MTWVVLGWIFFQLLALASAHVIGVLRSSNDIALLKTAQSMVSSLEGNVSVEFLGLPLDFQQKNTFDMIQLVRDMLQQSKVDAVVGPYDPTYAIVTQSLALPYVITERPRQLHEPMPNTVHIPPPLATFMAAITDLVQYFTWKRLAVFYDMPEGTLIVESLLLQQKYEIQAYNLKRPVSNDSYPIVDGILKDARNRGYDNYIVIASESMSQELLRQALYLSMMSQKYKWLVVNVHNEAFTWTEFIDTQANVTDLRMLSDWKGDECGDMKTGMMRDAVRVVVNITTRDRQKNPGTLCDACTSVALSGCTGELTFSPDGVRNDSLLRLFTLNGLVVGRMGTWRGHGYTLKQRVDFFYKAKLRPIDSPFGRRKVVIVTITEGGFVQFKEKGRKAKIGEILNINEIEGFLVDLLAEIAKMLKFEYTIYYSNKYGSLKPTGWTGMVQELIEQRADFALAAFSITQSRAAVVDFTAPYMIKGTTTIIKAPTRHVATFQFLAPLSVHVWVYMFVSYIVSSCVLFAMARFNLDKHDEVLFNMKEMFWYTWGTLLRGSTTVIPQATSSRVLISAWWFFSLIMISIYTANLAAFLTITSVNLPMSSSADLSDQTEYTYGTIEGSQIEVFFENTKLERYAKMSAQMKLQPDWMVRRVENGLERVKNEKYAFLWDSPTLRFLTQEHCDLMEIGRPFDLKGYGFPTMKDALFTDDLSWAILKLSDNDVTRKLEKKWLGKVNCDIQGQSATSDSIGLPNALGIFLVLGGGTLLSIIYCVIRNFGRIVSFVKSTRQKNPNTTETEMTATSALGNHYAPIVKFRAWSPRFQKR